MDKLEQYLDRVCRRIAGPRSLRQHVRQELREHLLDAVAERKASGLSDEEALARALEDFGGSDEVRSDLEATHGHRLMPVVIDKAMQWKEMTMRAKWLWTTWATLVVVGLVATEILFFAFSQIYLVPKLKKIQRDGWLDVDYVNLRPMAFLASCLNVLEWFANNATWCLLVALGLWGLFEWRVRSENKSFIRLSVLGTAALVLMVGVLFVSGALIIPFEMGLPGSRIARPWALEAVASADKSLAAIDQALAKKDWEAMEEHATAVGKAMVNLQTGPSLLSLTSRTEPPTLDELHGRIDRTRSQMFRLKEAIRQKDPGAVAAELEEARIAFGPISKLAKRAQ